MTRWIAAHPQAFVLLGALLLVVAVAAVLASELQSQVVVHLKGAQP